MSEQIQDVLARLEERFEKKFREVNMDNSETIHEDQQNSRQIVKQMHTDESLIQKLYQQVRPTEKNKNTKSKVSTNTKKQTYKNHHQMTPRKTVQKNNLLSLSKQKDYKNKKTIDKIKQTVNQNYPKKIKQDKLNTEQRIQQKKHSIQQSLLPNSPRFGQKQTVTNQNEAQIHFNFIQTNNNKSADQISLRQSQNQNMIQLSQKLSTTLQKIQLNLSVKNTNQLENSQMLARFEFYQKKRQKLIQKNRKQLENKLLYGASHKPEINQKSKMITNQQNYEPIYCRYEQIIEKKNKKIQQETQKKIKKQEQQYQQFLQQFNCHCKVPNEIRSINEFYEDMVNWKKKKDRIVEDIAQKKKKQQIEFITFKPIINKKSEKMASANRVPIQNREIKPKVIIPQFTFTPKINKRKQIK